MPEEAVLQWEVLVRYPTAARLAAQVGAQYGLDMWGTIGAVTLGWWRARELHLTDRTISKSLNEQDEKDELGVAIQLGLGLIRSG